MVAAAPDSPHALEEARAMLRRRLLGLVGLPAPDLVLDMEKFIDEKIAAARVTKTEGT